MEKGAEYIEHLSKVVFSSVLVRNVESACEDTTATSTSSKAGQANEFTGSSNQNDDLKD